MKKTIVACTEIVSLTILEVVALCKGIDGTLFTIIIAAVAGLGGLILPTPKFLKDAT